MKIKKIGILAISLIVVFTTLGIGYALWSDTVTLHGTINTGRVELGIDNLGTNDDGVTDNIVWCNGWSEAPARIGTGSADPQCGIGRNPDFKGFASLVSTDGTPNINCPNYYESVTETFTNVYPFYMAATALNVKNCGTIPLIICDIEANYTGGALQTDVDLVPWIDFSLCIEGIYIGQFDTLDALVEALIKWFVGTGVDLQIEPGEDVDFQLDFCFEEEADQAYPGVVIGDIMPQNATASYTITITGCQWNEADATPWSS